jgi:hypothetical protein
VNSFIPGNVKGVYICIIIQILNNMKTKNKLFWIVIAIIAWSCGCKEKHDTAFDGFLYPYDSLVNPKVFVYRRTDTTDSYFYRYKKVVTENGKKFLITTSLGVQNMKDSSKNLITGEKAEPVDIYVLMKTKGGNASSLTKGVIKKFEYSDKYRLLDVLYENPFNESSSQMQVESSFNSFITMQYRNKSYSCVLFDDIYKFKVNNKNVPSQASAFSLKYKSVLAKGLGMIQYTLIDKKKDRSYNWELDTIVDYDKFVEWGKK